MQHNRLQIHGRLVVIDMEKLDGRFLNKESLSSYTTWRVGGPADQIYMPATIEGIGEFLKTIPVEMPIFWIGRGSNLLVRDGGIRGVVIALTEGVDRIDTVDSGVIRAEAGASLSRLSSFVRKKGSRALDFLSGIPGSVGGALAMNAGAFGAEIWDYVAGVEVMNRSGNTLYRSAGDYRTGYRAVALRNGGGSGSEEWFVAAFIHNSDGEDDSKPTTSKSEHSVNGAERLRDQLSMRNSSQPMAMNSCGSVFMNPPGDFAGRLIEQSELKGFCIGGACVSEQHANFIVHSGDATAVDIEKLINHVFDVVKQRHGIALRSEVRIVGDPLLQKEEIPA